MAAATPSHDQSTQHYTIVGEVDDDLNCPVCLSLVQDPVQTKCGHLLCRLCLRQWLSSTTNNRPQCPTCRREISEDLAEVHDDKRAERKALQVKIECGQCCQTMIFKDWPEHKQICVERWQNCRFEDVGCLEMVKERTRKTHEEKAMNKHLDLACKEVQSLRLFKDQIDMSCQSYSWVFIPSDLLKHTSDYYGPKFYLMGYCLKFNVQKNENNDTGLYLRLCKGRFDDQLAWPFREANFEIILLDMESKAITRKVLDLSEKAECIQKPDELNIGWGYIQLLNEVAHDAKHRVTVTWITKTKI